MAAGGKRKGAGRPRTFEAETKQIGLVLPVETVELLDANANAQVGIAHSSNSRPC